MVRWSVRLGIILLEVFIPFETEFVLNRSRQQCGGVAFWGKTTVRVLCWRHQCNRGWLRCDWYWKQPWHFCEVYRPSHLYFVFGCLCKSFDLVSAIKYRLFTIRDFNIVVLLSLSNTLAFLLLHGPRGLYNAVTCPTCIADGSAVIDQCVTII